MKRQIFTLAAMATGLLLCANDATAQGGIPSPQEIRKRIKEAFPKLVANSPEGKIKVEGLFKITYKMIPTDPKKIAKALGKSLGAGNLPKGMDIEKQIGPYLPQIVQLLNEVLSDIGEFEALKEVKYRSKKIPVGKHRIGLLIKGKKEPKPVAIVIFNKDKKKMKKPVIIKLKTKSQKDLNSEVKIEAKDPTKKKFIKKFKDKSPKTLYLDFLRFKAKSKEPLHS